MSSLSKLWAISLISLAPSIISPIFATDITDNKINYDLNQIPPEKSLTNNHSSNRTSNVTKP
ncbi:MAG: hypothetical protein ACK47D_05215, partial [Pseudanabaena sp.]